MVRPKGGNYLRSTKMYPAIATVSKATQRLESALNELGVPKEPVCSARVSKGVSLSRMGS